MIGIWLFPVFVGFFLLFFNNCAIKIIIHILWFIYETISVVFIPRVDLLGPCFCMSSTLVDTTVSLTSKAVYQFYHRKLTLSYFNCSSPFCQHLLLSAIFRLAILVKVCKCNIVALACTSLIINDVEYLVMCVLVICLSFFCEVPVQLHCLKFY